MIIGIEISPNMLRAVRFSRFAVGRKPDRVAEVPIRMPLQADQNPAECLAEPIRLLLQELGAEKATVAVAVPSAWCAYRKASFPYRAAAKIESTLRYTLEGRLPQPIESYVAEPLTDILPTGREGAQILVATCLIDRIRSLIEALRAANLEPCIVQPAAVALARCPAASGTGQKNRGTGLIRLDGNNCEAMLVCKGETLACYVLRLEDLNLNHDEDVETLSQRIRFAARADQLGENIPGYDRIVLLAPSETTVALAKSLERHLEAPVEAHASDTPESKWAIACDMAAQAAKQKHTAVNLRRGELAYRPFTRRLERRLVAGLILAVAIAAMIGVYTLRSLSGARREIQHTLACQQALLSERFDTTATIHDLEAAVINARKEARAIKRTLMVSCVRRWWNLMTLIPQGSNVRLELVDINQTRIRIKAAARDGDRAAALQRRLQSTPAFMPNPTSKMAKLPNGGVSLEMELRYK